MHTCLTYFYVDTTKSTNFDMATFCNVLNIDENCVQLRDNGCMRIGSNTQYNVDINVMLRTTLCPLWDKRNLLVELRNKYNLTYYLARVPHIYSSCDQPKPLLSLDADIVAFINETGTLDDLDYYVY